MEPNNRLKLERELRGWSQARVAEKVGANTKTIGRWERGESVPEPYYLEQLCQLFGKDAKELGLWGGEEAGELPEKGKPMNKSLKYGFSSGHSCMPAS